MTDLEKAIAKRKKEAQNKDIEGKADAIARYLGEGGHSVDTNRHETAYIFGNKDFAIGISRGYVSGGDGSMGFSGTTVTHKGVSVFEQGGGGITLFIPGAWETAFEALYAKALKARPRKEREAARAEQVAKEARKAPERKRWGL